LKKSKEKEKRAFYFQKSEKAKIEKIQFPKGERAVI